MVSGIFLNQGTLESLGTGDDREAAFGGGVRFPLGRGRAGL